MRVGMHEMHALRVRGFFRDNCMNRAAPGWVRPFVVY